MERLKGLDGMRGGLALIVASSHAFSHFTGWGTGFNIVRNSTFAVDVFFILSGMVLYYNHKNSLTFEIREVCAFLKSRILRLYPLHIFASALIPLCLYFSNGQFFPSWIGECSPEKIITDIFLLGNFGSLTPYLNPPTWSISSELYIASIVIIICCYRPFISFVILFASILLMASVNMKSNEIHTPHYLILSGGILRCMLCVSIGVIGMLALDNKRLKCILIIYSSWIIGSTVITMLLIMLGLIPSIVTYTLVIILISLGIATLTQSSGPFISLLESKPFIYLGRSSYSIYLMHTPAIYLILYFKSDDVNFNILFAVISVLTTVIVSSLTFSYIERPLIKLGKR
ncbi:acyltransferase family protein [Pantoea septica]|uniref:acyltransferase family protein n=1 Tax=Pantoea septica TaxID=472695 RepID=UPI0023F41FED|nr:acyltransferase [Pantoea septica]